MSPKEIKFWLKQFTGFASPVRLDAIQSAEDVGFAKRFEAHFGETFKSVPDGDVWGVLQEIRTRTCWKPVPNMGQSICTRPADHDGPCRCSAADVDARRAS